MRSSSTILLLGMPGCGKSHLGKAAAQKLKIAFIDFDHYLEKHSGKTIPQIFEESGEEGFRLLEQKYLKQLLKTPSRRIIALGGGTPCFFDNIEVIKKGGLSIYLRTPVDDLIKRLQSVAHSRPLLKDKSEAQLKIYLKDLLKKREPFYNRADIVLDLVDADANAFAEWLRKRKEYI